MLSLVKLETITPEVEEEVDVDVLEDEEKGLVLFNDEVNTFDFVIESLVQVFQNYHSSLCIFP